MMKRRITQTIVALLAIVSSATAQTLSVASVEAKAGEQAELVVNASGIGNVTALQFNLTLPQGIALDESAITKGSAASGHTLSVQTMNNGDRLIVLYHMDLGLFANGELLRLPIITGQQTGTFGGSLNTIRTATTDAVSQKCADVTFNITINKDSITDGTYPLTLDMYHEWNGCTATSNVVKEKWGGAIHIGEVLGAGNIVYGDLSVYYTHYADLSEYDQLLIEGTSGMQLRVLLNRKEVGNGGGDANGGAWTELNPTIDADGKAIIDLSTYDFAHLNAIKTGWESPEGTISSIKIVKGGISTDIATKWQKSGQPAVYNLAGQRIDVLQKGLNIVDGKKVVKK